MLFLITLHMCNRLMKHFLGKAVERKLFSLYKFQKNFKKNCRNTGKTSRLEYCSAIHPLHNWFIFSLKLLSMFNLHLLKLIKMCHREFSIAINVSILPVIFFMLRYQILYWNQDIHGHFHIERVLHPFIARCRSYATKFKRYSFI